MNKAVFEMKPDKPAAADSTAPYSHKNQGKVPSYLNKYAKQREDEQIRKEVELEMSKHPPGTRLMPEAER